MPEQEIAPAIALDENDFNESEAEGQTATSDTSADDKKEAKPVEGDAESEDDADAEDSETEGDADSDADEAEDDSAEDTDEQPKKGAEARKSELQSEIRSLVSKRNDLRNEVAAKNAQVYHPATAEELVNDGMDPVLARVEASEQRAKMAEYNAHVADLTANLNTESLQVMADFPQFDPESSDYDAALANRANEVYKQVAQIRTDPKTGLIIQASVLPYQIYKAFAETASSGAQRGRVTGQKAAEKMLAAADVPSSSGSATKAPKEDPFLAGLTKGLKI